MPPPPTFADFLAQEAVVARDIRQDLRRRQQPSVAPAATVDNDFDDDCVRLGLRRLLVGPLGSKSSDAAGVFRVKMPSGHQVACKVLQVTAAESRRRRHAETETKILETLSDLALAGGHINFPVTFGTAMCGDKIVHFSELLDGDLKQWFTERPDRARTTSTQYGSAAAQVVLAIADLHAAGFAHCDSHWAQVLYKRLAPGGVWHYEVGGRSLFVRNVGFLFKISDFGRSAPLGHCRTGDGDDETVDVHAALGPFHDPTMSSEYGAAKPDRRTRGAAGRIARLSIRLGMPAHRLLAKDPSLLTSLDGVSTSRPRGERVLNPSGPIVIGRRDDDDDRGEDRGEEQGKKKSRWYERSMRKPSKHERKLIDDLQKKRFESERPESLGFHWKLTWRGPRRVLAATIPKHKLKRFYEEEMVGHTPADMGRKLGMSENWIEAAESASTRRRHHHHASAVAAAGVAAARATESARIASSKVLRRQHDKTHWMSPDRAPAPGS